MRTFDVARADVPRFVELSEGAIWPWLEGRDGRALGLWQTVMGAPERIVLITRYESLAHWEGTRVWSDPDARPIPADLEERGHAAQRERAALMRATDLIAMRPISQRMPIDDAPEAAPGIYALRTYRARPADDAEFARLSEEAIWPWFETLGVRTVALWRTVIAQDPHLLMLTRYDHLAHWEAARGAGPEPSDPEPRALWQAARDAIARRAALAEGAGWRILRPISRRRP